MDTYIHKYVPSFMLRSYTWTRGLVDARASEYPYVCRHTRVAIGGAAAHDGRAASKTGRAHPPRCAPPAGSGAYPDQRRDRRGVPRADVHVECCSLVERLRAKPHAVHADRKGSHVSAQIRERPNTHAHALTRMDAHVGSSVGQVCIVDRFIYVGMRA